MGFQFEGQNPFIGDQALRAGAGHQGERVVPADPQPQCDTHHHEPRGASLQTAFWTKEVATKGWDTSWGTGEKQVGVAQDLMGYLGEEPKVGFGDMERNKSREYSGKRVKGASCM